MTNQPPEFQQKTCNYCGTLAAPLATQCTNCGSNLPVALPRPVARMVEAQSHWGMSKTGLITSGISFALGSAWGVMNTGLLVLLLALWLVVMMPGMLGISAIINTKGDAGRFIVNVFAALGLYFAGIVLAVLAITAF